MRIEEGKYYRTRDGRKVGPAKIQFKGRFRFDGGHSYCHDPDGKYRGGDSSLDIVSEWPEGPVVTETVRRIEPGVYGRLWVAGERSGKIAVSVTSPNPEDNHMAWGLTASELREMARVALEIAEYLDAQ